MAIAAVERLEKKAAKDIIEAAREAFGLTYTELASALGVDRRTVLRYRRRASVPSPAVRARMNEAREIRFLLGEVFGDREARWEWLHSSVPLLRGRRPIDLIRQGKLDEVLGVLAGLYSGAYA